MTYLHSPYVVGFHGCDREVGLNLVTGKEKLKANNRRYHWLGSGIYFWENDPERALEWAQEKSSRGEIKEPYVIGGLIELGKCLDLSVRQNAPLIKAAHDSLLALTIASGKPALPENQTAPKDTRPDKVRRFKDCAVINHLAQLADPPFDTVRGLFVEGEPLYPGAEIYHKTHAEIAVRNPACIKGLFLPL